MFNPEEVPFVVKVWLIYQDETKDVRVLVKENKKHNPSRNRKPLWKLSGGRPMFGEDVEKGGNRWETPEEAAYREVEEETGLNIWWKELILLRPPVRLPAGPEEYVFIHFLESLEGLGDNKEEKDFEVLEATPEYLPFLKDEFLRNQWPILQDCLEMEKKL